MRCMFRCSVKISGKLYKWSQRCLRAHGLFGEDLRGWVLEFLQHFLSFCRCLVALNVCHLQLTLDRPRNVNVIKKLLSGLKNVLQKQTWCRHVAQLCHPSQTKRNTKSKKHSHENNACSQRSVTRQTDTIGLRKCDLGLLSHLSPRQLQQ
jgi:hypothetical protein